MNAVDSQALQAATPEQIELVLKSAGARYSERGVAPQIADRLFTGYMQKAARSLGFVTEQEAQRIDKTASAIAEKLGRARPTPAA